MALKRWATIPDYPAAAPLDGSETFGIVQGGEDVVANMGDIADLVSAGVSDGDKGDITVSGGGLVWAVDNDAITTAKIINDAVTTPKILNDAITAAKILADAVTTVKILDDAVTYAKMQNVSAADRLLGRSTAGAGNVEEIPCTAAGRALLDDADAAVQRTTLGVVGRHAVPIMAGSITPSASGGCGALATAAGAAGQPDIQYLPFDATTQEYAQFSWRMPESWDEGTLTFIPIWSHGATTTNFGVVWDLQAVAISNDDTLAVNFGTAQTSIDTGGTTDDKYDGPESSAITVAGTPAAGDLVCFRVSRVTSNGSDTMAIDARLLGVVVFMTTDAVID